MHKADRTRYVSDMAGAMSPEARAQADAMLQSIWQETSAEPVVVIVPSLEGEDVDDFATRLFTDWGIGKDDRDNGVLLLVSINDRKMALRTGYGAEGILPDAVCSRIIRNDLRPHFRNADYDGGILQALNTMKQAMTSDEARRELMSAQANDARAEGEDDFFSVYIFICAIMGGMALLIVVLVYFSNRKKPTANAYAALDRYRVGMMVCSFLSLGCVFPAYVLLLLLMRHVRLHKRLCPRCQTRMARVDEETDNDYLTPGQDVEERLDSVDYDVWLCPKCGETDIIPFINPQKNYEVCPQCHARAMVLTNKRTLYPSTTTHEGQGVEEYECLNCHNRTQRRFTIAKQAAPPVIIIPGGGFGGGGGGGFSGGSFGGGMTGGGGASGGW